MSSKYLSDEEYYALMANLYGKPNRIQDSKDFRQGIYVMKVIGSCWFEKPLPKNPLEEFIFYVNDDWPTEEPPKGIKEIVALPEESLEWLTPRLQKPGWVNNKTPRIKISLSKFMNQYQVLVTQFTSNCQK